MNKNINNGGPAFPGQAHAGMTLRDWFAGHALAGLIASGSTAHLSTKIVAQMAIDQADEMIAARKAS